MLQLALAMSCGTVRSHASKHLLLAEVLPTQGWMRTLTCRKALAALVVMRPGAILPGRVRLTKAVRPVRLMSLWALCVALAGAVVGYVAKT